MDIIIGREAPYFELEAIDGDGKEFLTVSLSDYSGKWLVLFFYPLDFTFICPTEITALSKRTEEFAKYEAEILGISTDSKYSHKAWINTPAENNGLGKINFPLASDFTKKTAKDYGVLLENEGVAVRGLFIIDPEGIIRYAVLHDLNVGRSTEETLRVLQALQTGGLCPIDWEPGDDLL